jgi:multidrug efflux pump subunit AcrB
VKLLEIGPPVGKSIQYLVSGDNLQTVRDLARKLGSIVGTDPSLRSLAFDWNEPARVVKIDVLQDKARQLGVSSQRSGGATDFRPSRSRPGSAMQPSRRPS